MVITDIARTKQTIRNGGNSHAVASTSHARRYTSGWRQTRVRSPWRSATHPGQGWQEERGGGGGRQWGGAPRRGGGAGRRKGEQGVSSRHLVTDTTLQLPGSACAPGTARLTRPDPTSGPGRSTTTQRYQLIALCRPLQLRSPAPEASRSPAHQALDEGGHRRPPPAGPLTPHSSTTSRVPPHP